MMIHPHDDDQPPITVAATGHRPPRLGLDYSPRSNERLTRFAQVMLGLLIAKGLNIREIISGFAQGWDLAVAHAAVEFGIPLTAALPFEGQDSRWPEQGRRRFASLLKRAKRVHVCRRTPSAAAYIERDHWMVNQLVEADVGLLVALFDKKEEKGGTWQTIKFANSRGVTVCNVWAHWIRDRDWGQLLGKASTR